MNELLAQLIESFLPFWVSMSPLEGRIKNKTSGWKKVDQLVEYDEDQYLSILCLTIMNSEMPISDRIVAGDKYVKKGGNGEVKKYYQQMLEEHTK